MSRQLLNTKILESAFRNPQLFDSLFKKIALGNTGEKLVDFTNMTFNKSRFAYLPIKYKYAFFDAVTVYLVKSNAKFQTNSNLQVMQLILDLTACKKRQQQKKKKKKSVTVYVHLAKINYNYILFYLC